LPGGGEAEYKSKKAMVERWWPISPARWSTSAVEQREEEKGEQPMSGFKGKEANSNFASACTR
jgi:hypothetical protein